MKVIAKEAFYDTGRMVKADTVLTFSKDELKEEMEKGRHEKTGKPLSAYLNHCIPGDDDTEEFLDEFYGGKVKAPVDKDDAEDIGKLREECDKLEIPYDRRWKLGRLKNEMVEAKKERGL